MKKNVKILVQKFHRSLSSHNFIIFLKMLRSKTKMDSVSHIHQDYKLIYVNIIPKVLFINFTKMCDPHCNGHSTCTNRGRKMYLHLKKLTYILVATLSFRVSSVLWKSIVRSYLANSSHQSRSSAWRV